MSQLSDEQAFKVGFLLYCAEQGMEEAEINETIKKALSQFDKEDFLLKEANPLLSFLGNAVGGVAAGASNLMGNTLRATPQVLSTLATLGIGIPVAAGAGTGYLAAKLTSHDKEDIVEDAKQNEVIGEYERLADEARRKARMKLLQNRTGRKVLSLGI